MKLIFLLLLVLTIDDILVEGIICTGNSLLCNDGKSCISDSHLCNYQQHCSGGSDENENFCKQYLSYATNPRRSHCNRVSGQGQYQCRGSCVSLRAMCRCTREIDIDTKMCDMISLTGKILIETPVVNPMENVTFTEILNQLNGLYELATTGKNQTCPSLYVDIGNGKCLSFFSAARVTWASAENFCKSIGGHLINLTNLRDLYDVLKYIKREGLVADYWIGGRFNKKNSTWLWLDQNSMEMGAPFWAISHNEQTCMKSSTLPPYRQTCQDYQILPSNSTENQCAAMTYENYYYFSDHSCFESKSPLCIPDPSNII